MKAGSFPLAALLTMAAAMAWGQSIQVRTEEDSGVRIQVQPAAPVLWGYAPLRATIRNDSGRERSWSFEFLSYGPAGIRRRSHAVLSVASGEERGFELTVPLASTGPDATTFQMRVAGFGVGGYGWEYPISTHPFSETGTPLIDAVSQSLHREGPIPNASSFDPDLLPSDWRGIDSLRTLVLQEVEWQRLLPGPRTALQDWVARGGRLVRIGEEDAGREIHGWGAVLRVTRPSEAAWTELLDGPSSPQRIPYASWASEQVEPIETRSGWLLLFLVGYGLLVGPGNLFVIASRGRRARLFWSMPAMAVGASVFLTILILLQDGVGGSGRRVVFVRLVPELAREVVVQEQVYRTGALLSSGFELEGPIAMFGFPESGELVSAGSSFGAGWFRSRSVQTHRLEAVRPGRARIERIADGSFLSAIDRPLDEIFYRDEDGECWRGADVAPGRAFTLEPATAEEYEAFWGEASRAGGPEIRTLLQEVFWERGAFLARARAGEGVAIETLEGIAWSDTVLYSGRISSAR